MSTQVVFTGTPDAFRQQQKLDKEKEAAAKRAKQKAARYNLTLRAKDLKKAKDEFEKEQEKEDSTKRKSLVHRVSRRLSRAISSSSSASKNVRRISIPHAITADNDKGRTKEPEDKKAKAMAAAAAALLQEAELAEDGVEDPEVLWMGELAHALESQAMEDINRAILTSFLSELAPERLAETDELLTEYRGNEEALFEKLATEYHVADEAALEGVPNEASEEGEEGYILSLMNDNVGKWAANVQSHVLKQRMVQAGASAEEVSAIMNNSSEMI